MVIIGLMDVMCMGLKIEKVCKIYSVHLLKNKITFNALCKFKAWQEEQALALEHTLSSY